jgi:hypothetical protein
VARIPAHVLRRITHLTGNVDRHTAIGAPAPRLLRQTYLGISRWLKPRLLGPARQAVSAGAAPPHEHPPRSSTAIRDRGSDSGRSQAVRNLLGDRKRKRPHPVRLAAWCACSVLNSERGSACYRCRSRASHLCGHADYAYVAQIETVRCALPTALVGLPHRVRGIAERMDLSPSGVGSNRFHSASHHPR